MTFYREKSPLTGQERERRDYKHVLLLILSFIIILPQIGVYSTLGNGLPDLIVEDIIWFPPEPHVAEDITIKVVIRNIGESPVKVTFKWELSIDSKDPVWWTYNPQENPPLDPDDTWTGVFDITQEIRTKYGYALTEGEHTLRATVDSGKRVTESNENNNDLKKTMTVGPPITSIEKQTSETTSRATGTTTMAIIKDIDYPQSVNPGEKTEINVTIEYSSPYQIRVGVFDRDLNKNIDERTENLGKYAGTKDYTFILTAPDKPQVWKLTINVIFLPYTEVEEEYVYTHSEDDWSYDLNILVGLEQTSTIETITTRRTELTETTHRTTTSYSSSQQTMEVSSTSTVVEQRQPAANYLIILIIIIIGTIISAYILKQRSKKRRAMRCKACNAPIPPESEFCIECGVKQ
ncbi:CARDB domain-containing protein [[Eubacterium] cellulosolvens]